MIDQMLALPAGAIRIADIGAAFLGEIPPYQPLLDNHLAILFAFEPDPHQSEALRRHLGVKAVVLQQAVGDGQEHTLHICNHGWTSLLEPDPQALAFFNTFSRLGHVEATMRIPTRRLDDIDELPQIDFLKMDAQGAELTILQHGRRKLSDCVAVQMEASFVAVYRNQPPFGAVDLEMREQGFIPHRFMDIKRWSIAPAIIGGDPRVPGNQLLECDILYVRDLVHADGLDDPQLKKLAAVAHHVCRSPDLAARCLVELEKRGAIEDGAMAGYLASQGLKR
ncbi:MAG TPA: FkbM family methyltransferase [Rhizomicrobium sp.]|nr:FkbM family methyltransferase [Rhizomicrobium sp.]